MLVNTSLQNMQQHSSPTVLLLTVICSKLLKKGLAGEMCLIRWHNRVYKCPQCEWWWRFWLALSHTDTMEQWTVRQVVMSDLTHSWIAFFSLSLGHIVCVELRFVHWENLNQRGGDWWAIFPIGMECSAIPTVLHVNSPYSLWYQWQSHMTLSIYTQQTKILPKD